MGACVAISVDTDGVEKLVIIAEVDERRLPADGPSGTPGAESIEEFWASAVRTVQGAVSEGHGLSVASVVFVAPRSLEKTSSGKPRRRYYKKLLLRGELAVLHENHSPQTA
jgi:hypothetical protein